MFKGSLASQLWVWNTAGRGLPEIVPSIAGKARGGEMATGKAVRVYSINKERLQEALDAIDKAVQSLRGILKERDAKE